MSEHKKKVQFLKRPDAFQKKLFGYFEWCRKHPEFMIKAGVAVVVVLGGAMGAIYFANYQTEKRNLELAAIDQIYDAENKKKTDIQSKIYKDIMALQEKKDKTPEETKQSENLETELGNVKGDYSGSLPQYLAFMEKYPQKHEGWRAGMNAVRIYLTNDKNFEKAEGVLETILSRSKGNDFYQFQVRNVYISVLEELKKFDKAKDEAELLVKSADDDQLSKALFVKGRVLLLAGKKDEAFTVFDQVISEHNSSAESQKAKTIKSLY